MKTASQWNMRFHLKGNRNSWWGGDRVGMRTSLPKPRFSCVSVCRYTVLRVKRVLLSPVCRAVLLMFVVVVVMTSAVFSPSGIQAHSYKLKGTQQVFRSCVPSLMTSQTSTRNGTVRLQGNSGQRVNKSNQAKNAMPNTETILMTPISIFSQKYAPRYTPNDTEFLGHLGVIHKQTWKYNKRNAKQFRVDLRAALGNEGKLQNFITTRQNTQIGQKLNFYRHRASSTVSKSFWRQLPKTVLYKPGLYRSCSVVGSSGLLKGSLCGNHIDKADFIFRFNLAPINGFKDDVGRKTNFTTLNPSFVRKRFNWLKTPENCSRFGDLMKQFRGSHLWLPAFALRSAHTHLMNVAHMVRKTKVATPIFGHPDHYTAVGNLWERTLNGTRWTTTGLHVLTSVFDLCHRIDVFGFWPFPKSLAGEDVPYHYHDSVLGVLKFHSFTKEFRGIMKLHELGIINVHLGPCT